MGLFVSCCRRFEGRFQLGRDDSGPSPADGPPNAMFLNVEGDHESTPLLKPATIQISSDSSEEYFNQEMIAKLLQEHEGSDGP
jgi:hypothetical protein